MSTKKLFKFELGLYYGECFGVFTAYQEEVDNVIGFVHYFGEIEGKHSCVEEKITARMFKVLSTEPNTVAEFERIGCVGYNIVAAVAEAREQIAEDEEEDDEDDSDEDEE